MFDAADAESVPHVHRMGLVHRLGNVPSALDPKLLNLGSMTPVPDVRWVNMQGPQGDCLDIETLTQCELDGRKCRLAPPPKQRQHDYSIVLSGSGSVCCSAGNISTTTTVSWPSSTMASALPKGNAGLGVFSSMMLVVISTSPG